MRKPVVFDGNTTERYPAHFISTGSLGFYAKCFASISNVHMAHYAYTGIYCNAFSIIRIVLTERAKFWPNEQRFSLVQRIHALSMQHDLIIYTSFCANY